MEPVGRKTYMLVRVGLNVREEEWFGLELGEREEQEAPGEKCGILTERDGVSAERKEALTERDGILAERKEALRGRDGL